MTEKELIVQLKTGSQKAFTELYNRYWKQVFNFCKLYVSNNVAEEVLQEVFIKLWVNRLTIDETKTLTNYLFIVTRNQIFDGFRKELNRDYCTISLIAAIEQSYDDLEEDISTADLNDYINSLIEALPPQCKLIFNLSRKENLTNQEIADKLNISKKTVEAAITRALKFIKQNMQLFLLLLATAK